VMACDYPYYSRFLRNHHRPSRSCIEGTTVLGSPARQRIARLPSQPTSQRQILKHETNPPQIHDKNGHDGRNLLSKYIAYRRWTLVLKILRAEVRSAKTRVARRNVSGKPHKRKRRIMTAQGQGVGECTAARRSVL
jgi:hypothetical protein